VSRLSDQTDEITKSIREKDCRVNKGGLGSYFVYLISVPPLYQNKNIVLVVNLIFNYTSRTRWGEQLNLSLLFETTGTRATITFYYPKWNHLRTEPADCYTKLFIPLLLIRVGVYLSETVIQILPCPKNIFSSRLLNHDL